MNITEQSEKRIKIEKEKAEKAAKEKAEKEKAEQELWDKYANKEAKLTGPELKAYAKGEFEGLVITDEQVELLLKQLDPQSEGGITKDKIHTVRMRVGVLHSTHKAKVKTENEFKARLASG